MCGAQDHPGPGQEVPLMAALGYLLGAIARHIAAILGAKPALGLAV